VPAVHWHFDWGKVLDAGHTLSRRGLSPHGDFSNQPLAVGGRSLLIAPRTDPYVRNSRIRLPPQMSGVEACQRIGMQNTGNWNPPLHHPV
jgi:hypothetical protein